MAKIIETIKKLSGGVPHAMIEDFLEKSVERLWTEYIMDIETVIKNRVDSS